jgi:hypothetical protein
MATGDEGFGLLTTEKRVGASIGCAVALGPYIYNPAPRRAAATACGTLTRGGLPVSLHVTEPLLRKFLEDMNFLENDLSRRWARTYGPSVASGLE